MTNMEDKIRQGYRVYDLTRILGKEPSTRQIDEIIKKLGPGKFGEIDNNNYLYVKTDPTWTDILGRNRMRG